MTLDQVIDENAPQLKRPASDMVREFHRKFGHPINETPTMPELDRIYLRLDLIIEEAQELEDAVHSHDNDLMYDDDVEQLALKKQASLIEMADALGDLEYVIHGMALEIGIPLDNVTKEIHRSNMTKLGENGEVLYRKDGKVMKGPNYEAPNLKKVLFG